jgi:hypothetical protein
MFLARGGHYSLYPDTCKTFFNRFQPRRTQIPELIFRSDFCDNTESGVPGIVRDENILIPDDSYAIPTLHSEIAEADCDRLMIASCWSSTIQSVKR